MPSEGDYQAHVIRRLSSLFPEAIILKNDSSYIQGIPDLTILWRDHWAMLEVKLSIDSPERPNQSHYVQMADEMSFAAFIYPENEEAVIDALQSAFGISRQARLFEPQ